MSLKERGHLISEVNIMRTLSPSRISSACFVQFYGWTINHKKRCIYLFMEYCAGGSLADLIWKRDQSKVPFSETFIWIVASQLIEGLFTCHHGPIPFIHRDLKPENIFIDSKIKIGDFGMVKILSHDEHSCAHTFLGTLSYMAPELFANSGYDSRSDIWSLGCILYQMCTFRQFPSIWLINAYHRDPGFLRFQYSHESITLRGYSHRLEMFIQSLLSLDVWIREYFNF